MRIYIPVSKEFLEGACCPRCGRDLEERIREGEKTGKWGCEECDRWIEGSVYIELEALSEAEAIR